MIKVINGKKYYPVSERIEFGLESMYDHAQYMMQCEYPDGKISNDEYDHWEQIAETCAKLMHHDWLCGADYALAKKITIDREWIRYNRCLAAGMDERDAAQALG